MLREYYDSNVLAILFAPLYPQGSRNCLWRMSHTQPADYVRKFPPLVEVMGPWSQHPTWKDLAGADDTTNVKINPNLKTDDMLESEDAPASETESA
jgi:hypothetical protein